MFKNKRIRFEGRKESNEQMRNQVDKLVARRFYIVMGVIVVFGCIFAIRLFNAQIRNAEYYDGKLEQYNTNMFNVDAVRGEITDRNYKQLVYNKNVICATYYSVKGIKDQEIKAIVRFLTTNCKVDISSVTKREKKDYLIMKDPKYVESLITKSEKKALESDDDYSTKYYNLELKRISDDILKKKLSNNDIKYYKLYSTIKQCTSGSAVLLQGISVKEASIIAENSTLLRGIQVTSDWERAFGVSLMHQTLGRLTTKKQGLPATLKDRLLALDYTNDARVGTSGIEQSYEDILKGVPSTYQLTYGTNGTPQVSQVSEGTNGANVQLSIDYDIQKNISNYIDKQLQAHRGEPFNKHIYCILEDPKTGEIIAMVGRQMDRKTGKIIDYSAGNYYSAYLIGSTMKAAVVYTAFKNHVIKPNHYESDGPEGLKIAGTATKHSWRKSGLGNLTEVSALAYSSNIWMMKVIIKLAGGHYQYNRPLKINPIGFTKLRNGAGELGLGVKTGIDINGEALGYRGKGTNPGLLLNFAIGQYDTYTNVQLATYATTLANGGVRLKPHLYKSSYTVDDDGEIVTLNQAKKQVMDDVSDHKTAFAQIKKGMKAVVSYGTLASQMAGFKYNVWAKTGTAEDYTYSYPTDYPNHMVIGYAGKTNPEIVCTVIVERQKANNSAPGVFKYALTQYFEKYGYGGQKPAKKETAATTTKQST